MAKWVSEIGETHLYPATSITDKEDAEDDPTSHAESRGRANGPAYCGYSGNGERVFTPDQPGDALAGFLDELSWRGGTWSEPCPTCRKLIENGALTDPVWQKRFREEVANA